MELGDFDPRAVALRLLCSEAPATIMGAPEDWPRWEVLLPHVLAATDQIGETGHLSLPGPGREQAVRDGSWLLGRAAIFLQVHGRPGEARPLAERALAIDEAAYGPDHPEVGTYLSNLALILRDLGELPDARRLTERALAIDEAAYGPDHPIVGTILSNLALILRDLGELPDARRLTERALAIDEAAY
ncbi:tetratricopeptide repeat protein, partial [Actinoplanes sp. NPDC004185]